jgi:hypothetical protein
MLEAKVPPGTQSWWSTHRQGQSKSDKMQWTIVTALLKTLLVDSNGPPTEVLRVMHEDDEKACRYVGNAVQLLSCARPDLARLGQGGRVVVVLRC